MDNLRQDSNPRPIERPVCWSEEVAAYYRGIHPESELAHFAVAAIGAEAQSTPTDILDKDCIQLAQAKGVVFEAMYLEVGSKLLESTTDRSGAIDQACQATFLELSQFPPEQLDSLQAYYEELSACWIREQSLHLTDIRMPVFHKPS